MLLLCLSGKDPRPGRASTLAVSLRLLIKRESELADDWYDDNSDTMVDGNGWYLKAYPTSLDRSIGVDSRLTTSQDRLGH
jgi:hypothetical protein